MTCKKSMEIFKIKAKKHLVLNIKISLEYSSNLTPTESTQIAFNQAVYIAFNQTFNYFHGSVINVYPREELPRYKKLYKTACPGQRMKIHCQSHWTL